jgi:hypothetical protein
MFLLSYINIHSKEKYYNIYSLMEYLFLGVVNNNLSRGTNICSHIVIGFFLINLISVVNKSFYHDYAIIYIYIVHFWTIVSLFCYLIVIYFVVNIVDVFHIYLYSCYFMKCYWTHVIPDIYLSNISFKTCYLPLLSSC